MKVLNILYMPAVIAESVGGTTATTSKIAGPSYYIPSIFIGQRGGGGGARCGMNGMWLDG